MSDRTIEQAITDCLDEHMPGYRIGGPPRPDWTAQAKADAARLYDAAGDECGDNFGLTRIAAFAAGHGLPADRWYVKAFRRELLLRRMRAAS